MEGLTASSKSHGLPDISGALSNPLKMASSLKMIAYASPKLYSRTLEDLHKGHQDTEKMQLPTHATVFWPSTYADLANYVRRCTLCMKHKVTQPVQPMLPHDIPKGPWQDITTYYFTNQGKEYLLICDTCSKYLFVYRASSKTAQSITQKLPDLILQYGLPKHMFTDNRPPFSSENLARFMQR